MKKRLLMIVLCLAITILLFGGGKLATLSKAYFGSPEGQGTPTVVLQADEKGHFFGNLTVNGTKLSYMVDSGASHVTLNSRDAEKARINYAGGTPVDLLTPNGAVQAFSLKLEVLVIGTIVLDDVEVTVVEGDSPPYVLLGVSAQNKLDVKRDNAVMTFGQKH